MLRIIGRESLILRVSAIPISVDKLSIHRSHFIPHLFRRCRHVATINYVKVVVRNDEKDVEHCEDCWNDEHGVSFQSSVFSL